ncbi:MAG: hypothetical protein PXZ07_00915 [Candidatus Eremiobacteraeota bacterium]|nr:hypothetical protein [Candidatus Eremiobacteraeota bacterium]
MRVLSEATVELPYLPVHPRAFPDFIVDELDECVVGEPDCLIRATRWPRRFS